MAQLPVGNLINGQWDPGEGLERLDVMSPLDGSVLSTVPLSTAAELDRAVEAAAAAFVDWSARTIRDRSQVVYRYRDLLERHTDELAELVHLENGKTLAEGRAEVAKAIEVTEFACSLPQMVAGEVLEVSPGVECRVDRCPLGVVASITPFNFPCMVPHWTIPIAITLGNSFILKPSEQVPLTARLTGDLLARAGLPDGVFGMVNGDRGIVEAICDHPGIAAVSFVGSTPVARSVYARAAASGKRALGMGGAKNHLVVLPDADVELTAENVTESATGCAGQRCMAAASLVAVGDVDHIVQRVCEKAGEVVVGQNLGAVISAEARDRIVGCIDEAEAAGARVLVDGRGATVDGCEGGYYVGATVLDDVTPEMAIAQQEVFGPVLAVIRASDMDEALDIERRSPFGNAAAIYTRDGGAAREFASRATSGMIGVNIGVPVPREPFGFGGWNDSRFGVGNITGEESVAFWTQSRKVTSRWPGE
ncbi:MAG TPA: methylmalonate-semialdehyde dehydrogenase (CoA acylating) [Planctomycetaceae bacterium]|jgi:malonate-semialdehyde dehydrogenase (acetylating)/methylmalonate-semialdehyde dehydrogenase|nr:methylmalonate-semialdehyde dehydrogenase (CoA acylating) [Planctomycetaceae bacterium]HCK54593.1 methylmalonate-semialdehyde dehydrogenase (CoA acylating) [Planctomycetaceae bacterium]